ncbi:MAG TPA: VanW family protein [Candidatus Methylomirabilis sp.]|nr:VanW family protein [Candidatus Methylomirabilis sp.]
MLSLKKQENEKKPNHHWLLYLVAAFFIAADVFAASYFVFAELYKNRIYPGVKIGRIDLSGKTAAEAKEIIAAKINDLNQNGVKFSFEKNEVTLTPVVSSFSSDLARQIISFDIDKTVSQAFAVGHGHNFLANLRDQFFADINGWSVKLSLNASDKEIKKILADRFDALIEPPRDAQLIATTTAFYGKKEIIFQVKDEKAGFDFAYDRAIAQLINELSDLDSAPIALAAETGQPDILKNESANLDAQARQFLDKTSLTLVFADKKWPIAKNQIADWLKLVRDSSGKVVIGLDEDKIQNFLETKISPQIAIDPKNARFLIKDGKVTEFVSNQDGRDVNFAQTFQTLNNDWFAKASNTITVATEIVKSDVSAANLNSLGVTEIIGTGHSNFSGSPKNRIHNIGVGAAALNGLLIAPGEEFSTDTALGEVTAATGYLPEMTIMGDKTVPQYGGGLCQIGTTMFRAALASGFPITARQPHSYRVVYYEPAGTDATIFQPWPDLRFINDSGNYVLIQTRIDGNDIYFDLWGTKDGRVVEETDPTIYNIVKPEPTKYVETLDLPPGQKKCTERAHNGADAFFDYKVTYPDGTVKQKRFSSHYVPWREVCLIGVAQLSASSTPAIAP